MSNHSRVANIKYKHNNKCYKDDHITCPSDTNNININININNSINRSTGLGSGDNPVSSFNFLPQDITVATGQILPFIFPGQEQIDGVSVNNSGVITLPTGTYNIVFSVYPTSNMYSVNVLQGNNLTPVQSFTLQSGQTSPSFQITSTPSNNTIRLVNAGNTFFVPSTSLGGNITITQAISG